MAKLIQPPRGMKDVLPQNAARKQALISTLLPIYHKWGFTQIETPALEEIQRLIHSDGGENEKLVYQVLRRGLNSDDYQHAVDTPEVLVDLGLRFDLTVPMARYYATNHAHFPEVARLLNFGPVWRAERPQKGRFRQFMQWDADVIGPAKPLAEMELLMCTAEALAAVHLGSFTVRINDRRLLSALASQVGIDPERHDETFIIIDKIDKIGLSGIEKQLLERGFTTGQITALITKLSPFVSETNPPSTLNEALALLDLANSEMTDDLEQLFSAVHSHSQSVGYRLLYDPTLVRGMGYYTEQIFEVSLDGYAYSIAGGGRYDRMIGRMLNHDVQACGFSIGFDRIADILETQQHWPGNQTVRKLVLLVPKTCAIKMWPLAEHFRAQGWDVALSEKRKNLKPQLDAYLRSGFSHYALADDVEASAVTIKALSSEKN